MNSILCAIDFTEPSVRSLKWAFGISDGLAAHLEVLFTYRLILPEIDTSILEYKRQVEQEAKTKFKAIEKDVRDDYLGPYSFHVEVGYLSDRIRDRLNKMSYGMIIVPNHMTDQFLSGNLHRDTQSIIQQLKVPIVFHA